MVQSLVLPPQAGLLVKSPSENVSITWPMGAWEGSSGKPMPCAMSVFVNDIIVISKVYNFVFISNSIPKSTHHPTNKKPHECGA
jgi:hypothetical protein